MSKCQVSLIIFHQNSNAALEKNIAHNLLEKWKNYVGKRMLFGTLLTGLSKAFD